MKSRLPHFYLVFIAIALCFPENVFGLQGTLLGPDDFRKAISYRDVIFHIHGFIKEVTGHFIVEQDQLKYEEDEFEGNASHNFTISCDDFLDKVGFSTYIEISTNGI